MPLFGAWSYGLASAAYLVLAVLLIAAWAGRGPGFRLVFAAVATALWAATLAFFALNETAPPALLFTTETVRHAAWLVVLAGLVETGGLSRGLAKFSYVAWILALLGGLAVAYLAPAAVTDFVMISGLLLPLLGLVLLEQIYRNSNPQGRWSLKFLYLGVGGILVYDVFLYSQGLLLKGISIDAWYARGLVVLLTAPFVLVAARRNPAWSLRVFVSRDVAFYTSSFVAVGGYALLMAGGGYLVKLVGGSWGGIAQIVFLAAAAGLLAMLVGSAALRRNLKVFLVKHFYQHKYEYRDEWLRFISTLSSTTESEDARTNALRAVAQIIHSPAAVLLRLGDQQDARHVAAVWPRELPAPAALEELCGNRPLIELLGRREWVVDLQEFRRDRELYEGLELPESLCGRREWRLIVPVLLGSSLFGLLLLKDPPAGFTLTFEDRDLLKTVSRHIATHLAQHESEQRLAEARQFEAYSRLTAFLMHDLKNAAAQLQLVVANAARHRNNPEFVDDAIVTVDHAAHRITHLIEQLQAGEVPDAGTALPLAPVVQLAVERCADRSPAPRLVGEGETLLVTASRDRLANILEHVIRNAQDATPAGGSVEVEIGQAGGSVVIAVRDTGAGMSAEFLRERLFRPFDSTKGSKGMGIGAYQVREYVRALGGEVEVDSAPGRGTTFTMKLPLVATAAVA